MSGQAKWYMQDEVARLLENWGRWPGWNGATSARSTLGWIDDFVSNKRVGDYTASIPVMGGEAADTQRALGRMEHELAAVLIVHYTGRGGVQRKLAQINQARDRKDHLSKRTYYRRLEAAHPAFMDAYRAGRRESHVAASGNFQTHGDHAGVSVARRHRLVVTPKMGLKAPEKAEEKQG